MRIQRIVLLIAVIAIAGAGYKYGPTIYQKVKAKTSGTHTEAAASQPVAAAPRPQSETVATNSAGIKLCSRDLGTVSLTNHFDTCVSLGKGKNCVLTPVLIDKATVQITFSLESKGANGKIHDLSITQVVTPSGRPFEVAVGDFSFSLTPAVVSQ
jgi:hypothetical protein